MKKTLLLLCACSFFVAQDQLFILENKYVANDDLPSQLVTGDFNGDGQKTLHT